MNPRRSTDMITSSTLPSSFSARSTLTGKLHSFDGGDKRRRLQNTEPARKNYLKCQCNLLLFSKTSGLDVALVFLFFSCADCVLEQKHFECVFFYRKVITRAQKLNKHRKGRGVFMLLGNKSSFLSTFTALQH